MLTYDFPIDGGKVEWHCLEITFVFHNNEKTALYNVAGETDVLEKQILKLLCISQKLVNHLLTLYQVGQSAKLVKKIV